MNTSTLYTHTYDGFAAETKVSILIEAKDKATSTLNHIEGKLGTFSKGLGTLAKVGGAAIAVATTAIVAFGVSSVKAFSEAQVQMARFNTMVKNVPGNTQKMTDSLLKTADAAVKLGFDDEDAANSLANLYQRTHDVTQAIDLNNFSMDLARAKNISLADASRSVSMVLSGNAKALKEYGIELDETKTPMQGLMEAQKILTGQAKAYSETIEGKIEIMKIKWENLKETIGGIFAGYVTKALTVVLDIMDRMEKIDFGKQFDKAKESIVGFFEGIEKNSGIVEYFMSLWNRLKEAYDLLLKPALDRLVTQLGGNKDMMEGLTGNFGKFMLFIVDKIFLAAIGVLTGLFSALADAIAATKWVVNALADAFLWIETTANRAGAAIRNFFVTAQKNPVGTANSTLQGINSFILNPLGAVTNSLFRASGGPVSQGGSYIVGEQGPEMFVPSSSGTIIPNNRMGGGVAITVNVNGGNYLSRDAAEMFGDTLIERLKENMRL